MLFLPKLANQEPKDPPDWIIVDIWALPSIISVDTLLAKTFLIWVISLVKDNSSQDAGAGEKAPPVGFSPVTSTNVGISPQNVLVYSFNPFVTLM